MEELSAKGYATEAGSDDWGASKRALLAFARSDDLLPAIGIDSIKALVATDIQYLDRKVRNARQRLSLLGGDTPTDIGTGEPSFQDVVRLLMAVHLAGDERTSDNEAAGAPVLRQVLQCLRLQPTAAAASAKTSSIAARSPASAPQRQGGRGTQKRQARSWEAAPWSKSEQ
jgi:hypothetical protein